MNNPTDTSGERGPGSLERMVRRRLIMDFMALGQISRWSVCEIGGWLTDADHTFRGQERWAVAFERAEKRGQLAKLRELVDAESPNDKLSHAGPTASTAKAD